MRILFVGDVVGRSGRTAISEHLPGLIRDWSLDLVVVNGENAAGGFGITEAIYQEFLDAGADAVTLGNHAWDQREALVFIERAPRLVRPANFPRGTPGRGAALVDTKNGKRALVINAIGRVFMTPFDDPVRDRQPRTRSLSAAARRRMRSWSISIARRPAKSRGSGFSATAAPVSWSAPTPMCRPPTTRFFPGGTAYMTDAGMTGDYDSIIGMQKEEPLRRFTSGIPSGRFEPAHGRRDAVPASRSRPTMRPGSRCGSRRCGSAAGWSRRCRRFGRGRTRSDSYSAINLLSEIPSSARDAVSKRNMAGYAALYPPFAFPS